MTDWDLLTPGIGLTSIGIVGVGISLSGIAKTFIDGMHAVSLLTMFIGMIFLASGLFKDGFPSSGRAKSATFITLGFLVTFGFAAAVTVSTQVPSIFAYIGLMLIISVPATVLAVASFRQVPYIKALAVIFIGASIVGGTTFYAFGLVTPRPPAPAEEGEGNQTGAAEPPAAPTNIVNATILAGSSAANNPSYEPDPLVVKKGDGVQWTNEDNVPHTVTSKEEGLFDSSLINPSESWLLNTAELDPAEYLYYCFVHPHMEGTLVVSEDGAAPAGGSSNTTAPSGNATGPEGQQQQTSNQSSSASNETASAPPASGGGSGGATVTQVSIVVGSSVPTNGEYFDPEAVETTVGSMVTWINDDSVPHTVTSGVVENNSPTPDGRFDSSILNPGQSFSFVFDAAGEYPYYCMLHPWMTGTVTVN
ncbi:MAG TPA: plastocyanin/azurin family copper-binding protein [Nitrososphaera sp.]|jgi:plastocyanin